MGHMRHTAITAAHDRKKADNTKAYCKHSRGEGYWENKEQEQSDTSIGKECGIGAQQSKYGTRCPYTHLGLTCKGKPKCAAENTAYQVKAHKSSCANHVLNISPKDIQAQ